MLSYDRMPQDSARHGTIPHRHSGRTCVRISCRALIFLGWWWSSECVVFHYDSAFNGAGRNKTAQPAPHSTSWRTFVSKINYPCNKIGLVNWLSTMRSYKSPNYLVLIDGKRLFSARPNSSLETHESCRKPLWTTSSGGVLFYKILWCSINGWWSFWEAFFLRAKYQISMFDSINTPLIAL